VSDFAPGDLALCLGKDAACDECGAENRAPAIGRIYRVASVSMEPHWRHQGLALAGVPMGTSISGLWCACGFRKIRPAEESFTEQVRACKPIKHRVSA
jgi:hypothetical protein